MKFKYTILFICLGMVIITSCKKEVSNEFIAYSNNPLNDTTWALNLKATDAANTMIAELVTQPETATISLSEDEVTCRPAGNDSLRIVFRKGIFTTIENGVATPVKPEGTATVEVLRIRRSADLIRCIRPCRVGNNLTILGGGVFIRVLKDGKELSIKDGESYLIKLAETGVAEPNENMKRMFGSESNPAPLYNVTDPNFSWKADTDNSDIPLDDFTINGNKNKCYLLKLNRFRWISAARLISSTGNTNNKVAVYFPQNFTNKNTNVYAVITGQKTVIKLDFEYVTRSFITDLISDRIAFKLVSISKIGNDFYLGDKLFSSGITSLTPAKLEPQKISKEKLQAYLDDL